MVVTFLRTPAVTTRPEQVSFQTGICIFNENLKGQDFLIGPSFIVLI